ncbi:MAG: BamA/TamA family outer membrane protein [Chitinophagaceae bacterium]|nr:BamA/TamA family outer membrane protein [Chitinophagaceae bacterium]
MISGRSYFQFNAACILFIVIACISLWSCGVVPRNYPIKKPFVFKNTVSVEGNFTRQEKKELETRLEKQLDDSLRVRTTRKFIYKGINRPVLNRPPVFLPEYADRSVQYMKALLTSLGYFRDTITYTVQVDTVTQNQYRTTISFLVKPGKPVRIDSLSYQFFHPAVQQLVLNHLQESRIKKGDAFSKSSVSEELDRLVLLLRNHGYMRFGREELIGLWDTLNISLLRPTFDPLEQAELLKELRKRRENPTANLEIRLKPGYDSTKLIQYHIGHITVYPDITADTTENPRKETHLRNLKIVTYQNNFKSKIFPDNIFLKRGEVYDQRNYIRTINRLNSIGAWRLVNIEALPRPDSDTADFNIKLTPARKYSFTANMEGSRNNSVISGNLFGIALNLGFQNRNFAKSSGLSSTNLRFGIETGRDTATLVRFLQTLQLTLNHSISFPRPVPRMSRLPEKVRTGFRSILSFNSSITERRLLYNFSNFNISWGYEFPLGKKLIYLRLPNIEYTSFQSRPRLDSIFGKNPALRNIFADGLITSAIAGLRFTGGKGKHVNVANVSLETSGLITGFFRNPFLDSNLFRFIKIDVEVARKIQFARSSLVLHFFTGVGYEFESTVNERRRYNLPLLRQYFAGGPNSMRAWALRKLGPGSHIRDFGNTGLPDRYGDLQLEANIEYRFPMFTLFDFPVEGALFTDIGNIWFVKKAPNRPLEEVFQFSRLGKDIAVGVGAGLRADLKFFVIRLDYSIKAKDPSPSPNNSAVQNRWFGYKRWRDADQLQLAISYPFVL